MIHLRKTNGMDYPMVDDCYTRTKNPAPIGLLEEKSTSDLEPIHIVADAQWGRAVLYEVK